MIQFVPSAPRIGLFLPRGEGHTEVRGNGLRTIVLRRRRRRRCRRNPDRLPFHSVATTVSYSADDDDQGEIIWFDGWGQYSGKLIYLFVRRRFRFLGCAEVRPFWKLSGKEKNIFS